MLSLHRTLIRGMVEFNGNHFTSAGLRHDSKWRDLSPLCLLRSAVELKIRKHLTKNSSN